MLCEMARSWYQPFIKPKAKAAAKLPVSGMPILARADIVWSAALGMVPVAFCRLWSVPSELATNLSQWIVIICWCAKYARAAKKSPTMMSISFITFFIA